MNSTNRALNRIFLALVGLLLLAAAAITLGLGVVAEFRRVWRSAAASVRDEAPGWIADRSIGGASGLTIAIAVVAVILIVLLVAFIARQGHGRTAAAIEQSADGNLTRIDLAIPRTLLEDHLGARDDIIGLRISAYEVRGAPMLKITARCRRGASPAWMADVISSSVSDLEEIVGTDIPTFIQLTGGFRVRTARPTRVV